MPTINDTTLVLTEATDSTVAPGDSVTTQTDSLIAPEDSLVAPEDSLVARGDSLASQTDSLIAPEDTIALLPAEELEVPEDTITVLPADSAFVAGTLMPGECSPHIQGRDYVSDSYLADDILVAISILAGISVINRIVRIFPSAFTCLGRWKEILTFEFSTQLCRDRDAVFAALIPAAWVMVDRHWLYFPDFMSGVGHHLHLILSFCLVLLFLLLRLMMRQIIHLRDVEKLSDTASHNVFRTFFILTTLLCLAMLGVLSIFRVPEPKTDLVLFIEVMIFYAVFLLRKGQILVHCCSLFSTILYLCGLEILPVGILTALAVIF